MKKILLFLLLFTLPLTACTITMPSSPLDKEEDTVVNPDDDEKTPVVPDENTSVIPDENTPVVPDENTPVVPDENTPVVPDESTPVVPDENTPVVPDENTPVDPDGDDDPVGPVAKEFLITAPVFETRKLSSIDEVTMDDFFNLGNRVDIKVTISDSELKKLQSDYETGYKSEIYRLASKVVIKLTNQGTTFTWEFENVGIRQKGNTSRNDIIADGKINKNHYKLSFDETFDDPQMYDSSFISKYGNASYSNREFLGLSGLDFKWDKNYDATHIREIYANYLYRASGILAQHSGLSTFSLIQSDKSNKETSMGLCTVYEPATKSFIKRSLKSDTEYVNMGDWTTEKNGTFGVEGVNYGDLYKCIYGADLTNVSGNVGVGNISGSYIPKYDRKTNKNVDYNDQLLKNASNAIKTGDYNTISQYVDLEYLAICEAVGYVVGNPDSMRYNTNNYMIYMRRTDGKMVFIPIDCDRSFGIVKDWNIKEGLMYVGMLDRKNSNDNNTISLLLNTILSKTTNDAQKLYVEFCNKIKDSAWATNDTFNTYFNMAKSSYSEYSFSLTNEDNNYTFSRYMNNKMKQITPVNDNTGNNSGNNNQGSTQEYNNIYLVSSLNNWGNYSSSEANNWKLQKVSDNTYSITFTVTALEVRDGRHCFSFKFNNGYSNYDQIDWRLSDDFTKLQMEVGSSNKCYNASVGDVVTITINTKTLEASLVIH